MKKTLVAMFALFLAVPTVSYAGSATSRWDLTIGGNVKFDIGWSDESAENPGSDMWVGGLPLRDSTSGNRTSGEKYGTQLWGAGETAINFFIKGPDTWGAKTHAFIAGDFTGFWGAAQGTNIAGPGNSYNTFNLLIAQVGFDWASTSLAFGVAGSFWGQIPTWSNSVGWNVLNFGGKGAAPVTPQITVTQRFRKNFTAGFGVMTPHNTVNQLMTIHGAQGVPEPNQHQSGDPFTNPLPAFEGKVAYSSDSWGKVGPWQLLVEVDGFWGRIRRLFGTGNVSHKDIDEWFADFKFLIPIIPEKGGNKAMGLYGDATIFATQGGGSTGNWYANAAGQGGPLGYGSFLTFIYQRAADGDFHANLLRGLYTHAQFYFTDAMSVNGWWTYSKVNASRALRSSFPDGAVQANQYVANLQYDVNPAVRFTLEWEHTNARFAAQREGKENGGTNNAYRLAAYYFF
jgi:hypothetical protein